MSDENLFESTPGSVEATSVVPATTPVAQVAPNPAVVPVIPAVEVVPQELVELVGVGKKYKTVNDAMNSIPHAQTHIVSLTEENARMKEELTRRATAEELLADMRKTTPEAQATPVATEVNPDVISEIVKQQIENTRQVDLQKQNSDSVVNAFTTHYADKAEVMYNKVATDNGMSLADVNALAKKSPQALLNLAGLSRVAPLVAGVITGNVNQQSQYGGAPPVVTSAVLDYGKSSSIADGMRRAKEIVNARLNS